MNISTSKFSIASARILSLGVLLAVTWALLSACGDAASSSGPTSAGPGGASPTDAYKKLYAAVKAKDTEAIKSNLSKKTIDFAAVVSQKNNKPLEEVFANGFTATTFADRLPEIRDERINEDMSNVEVWNAKDKKWEDLPFVLEEGGWKLAVGDLFAGTFKSPGKGRAQKEAEAANVLNGNTMQPIAPDVNGNFTSAPRPPKPSESPASTKRPK